MRSALLRLFSMLIVCGISFGFPAPTLEYVTISHPESLIGDTRLQDINNSGQIVGFYDQLYGFIYYRGTFTGLLYPGKQETKPWGINDQGQIVGTYLFEGKTYGFLYHRGVFSTLDLPGAPNTYAYNINNRGQIVGDCIYEGVPSGWLYEKGRYVILRFPGAVETNARGINDRGQIVGNYSMPGGLPIGFLYVGGQYHSFPEVAGASGPRFWDINSRGQIVGQIWGPGRAFVLYRDAATILQIPDSRATLGRGINDHGQVVGFYNVEIEDDDETTHIERFGYWVR